jgi:1,4-alpha-glucan branching enzyme
MGTQGYLALVLHAHLPYVRHPEHSFFLEEDWFYEAVTETYIPLLQVFESLAQQGIPFRLTISMSPPLLSMLTDDLLKERYLAHLSRLRELTLKEGHRNRDHGHLRYLASHYEARVEAAIRTWQEHDGNLVRAFARLQDEGYLDILTCAATHGYLPLLQVNPQAVRAQIQVAVEHYIGQFRRPPTGMWLPECGLYPGLDRMLADAGIRYVVVDMHALLLARPRPRFGNHAPIFCTDSGIAAFGRDMESSLQVWSREHGYPGDYVYRDFYRDIGFDLDPDYIGPYVQPNGARKNTGIKYHRITGKTEHKELYDPYWAREKAAEHAGNFVFNRERQIEYLAGTMGRPPIVVSPYDAELLGHWWYEGPWWLDYLMRKAVCDQQVFRVTHLAEYLKENTTQQTSNPAQSSWGDRGFHEFWLNSTNEWIYPHLHKAAERMIGLVADHPQAEGILRRALNQAARELLLAQSSDWAFIMRTGTMVQYAVRRTQSHLRRFLRLFEAIRGGTIDEPWLARVEYLDNIFPALDYHVYSPQATP